ncbi:uncharacterized protein VTP21DRAFT_2975 [Calcarisporiella thermophila]|uniref:uncharacterized protein n=1 Tax=Calcarisporiella thermophila TaxID=911321 RepID=UPI003742A95F
MDDQNQPSKSNLSEAGIHSTSSADQSPSSTRSSRDSNAMPSATSTPSKSGRASSRQLKFGRGSQGGNSVLVLMEGGSKDGKVSMDVQQESNGDGKVIAAGSGSGGKSAESTPKRGRGRPRKQDLTGGGNAENEGEASEAHTPTNRKTQIKQSSSSSRRSKHLKNEQDLHNIAEANDQVSVSNRDEREMEEEDHNLEATSEEPFTPESRRGRGRAETSSSGRGRGRGRGRPRKYRPEEEMGLDMELPTSSVRSTSSENAFKQEHSILSYMKPRKTNPAENENKSPGDTTGENRDEPSMEMEESMADEELSTPVVRRGRGRPRKNADDSGPRSVQKEVGEEEDAERMLTDEELNTPSGRRPRRTASARGRKQMRKMIHHSNDSGSEFELNDTGNAEEDDYDEESLAEEEEEEEEEEELAESDELEGAEGTEFDGGRSKRSAYKPRGKSGSTPRRNKNTLKDFANVPVAGWQFLSKLEVLDEPVGVPKGWLKQRVYTNVTLLPEDYTIVSEEDALDYLPKRRTPVTIELKSSGGADELLLDPQQSINLDDYYENKQGCIVNAAGSVWGLDWCPLGTSKTTSSQYLAISGYRGTSDEHHGLHSKQPATKGCIQIWRIDSQHEVADGEPRAMLDLCLLHDFGYSRDIKWCPYGTFVECPSEKTGPSDSPPGRLGLLAGCFGDGSLKIFNIPHPEMLRRQHGVGQDETVFVQLTKPLFLATLPDTRLHTVCWMGHTQIAAGCSNGKSSSCCIVVWNIEEALEPPTIMEEEYRISAFEPLHYLPAHDSCVSMIEWGGPNDPTLIASTGKDGRVLARDLRDPWTVIPIARTLTPIDTILWPYFAKEILYMDSEDNIILVKLQKENIVLMNHWHHIWSASSSHFHPFIATASADGRVKMTNMYEARGRYLKVNRHNLYQLAYNNETDKYHYLDSVVPEIQVRYHTSVLSQVQQIFAPEASIQRVSWCPNSRASAWIASGGMAGLVRVEKVRV